MSVHLREKNLSDGRVSLYLDIYHKGHRHYEFLEIYLTKDRQQNKESRSLAENIRAKRLLEMQSAEYGFSPQFKKKIDFLTYFKQYFETREKNEGLRGIVNYKCTLKHLEAYCKSQPTSIGTIDEKWLEGFKAYVASKVQKSTANLYYAKVKAAIRQANKEGYMSRNPSENVKYFAVAESERSFLTEDEVHKLAQTPCSSPDVKRAFLFACHTGLRFSDVKALTWGDIKDGRAHFRQKKTLGFEYLPLNESALSIIAQSRKENELPLAEKPVFNIPDKSHISAKLRPWLTAAGISKEITFHCSRHTFATSLLTAGTDLYTTSKLLGHRNISSTAIYAKIVDEKKLKAVNSLPQIGVLA